MLQILKSFKNFWYHVFSETENYQLLLIIVYFKLKLGYFHFFFKLPKTIIAFFFSRNAFKKTLKIITILMELKIIKFCSFIIFQTKIGILSCFFFLFQTSHDNSFFAFFEKCFRFEKLKKKLLRYP